MLDCNRHLDVGLGINKSPRVHVQQNPISLTSPEYVLLRQGSPVQPSDKSASIRAAEGRVSTVADGCHANARNNFK